MRRTQYDRLSQQQLGFLSVFCGKRYQAALLRWYGVWQLIEQEFQESRDNAGRTARGRWKFRYLSILR